MGNFKELYLKDTLFKEQYLTHSKSVFIVTLHTM